MDEVQEHSKLAISVPRFLPHPDVERYWGALSFAPTRALRTGPTGTRQGGGGGRSMQLLDFTLGLEQEAQLLRNLASESQVRREAMDAPRACVQPQ